MVAQLVQNDYLARSARPSVSRIKFWLREARTVELLLELVRRFPDHARSYARGRPAVAAAIQEDPDSARRCLMEEAESERALDRAYWSERRRELEQMR